MKQIILTAFLTIIISFNIQAQDGEDTCASISPEVISTQYLDIYSQYCGSPDIFVGSTFLVSNYSPFGSCGEEEQYVSAYETFDFSSIPTEAIIHSANLNLTGSVSDPFFGGGGAAMHPDFELRISRLTEEFGVSFGNGPSTSNGVSIDFFEGTTESIDIDIDVTNIVQQIINNENFGFAFEILGEFLTIQMNLESNLQIDYYLGDLDIVDEDGDSVIDCFDAEINSPCPDSVDENGVSIDSDGDGFVDCLDDEINSPCPDNVDENGVSPTTDTDGDEIADCFDAEINSLCPDNVDENGVSIDTDIDGVVDCLDDEINSSCPDNVDENGVSNDTDDDGIVDCLDDEINSPCPDNVDENGVSPTTDTDGDGIINCFDQEVDSPCPNSVDENGVSFDLDNDGIADCVDCELELTIDVIEDMYLNAFEPLNVGDVAMVENGSFLIIDQDDSRNRHSYIRFNLDDLQNVVNYEIVSATLELTTSFSSGLANSEDDSLVIREVTGDWNENESSIARPTYNTNFEQVFYPANEYEISDIIIGMLESGNNSIELSPVSGEFQYRYFSINEFFTSKHPKLKIIYEQNIDTDGDGILDCEDECIDINNTLDTDGDGIPDCIDLEINSPCPNYVDGDGVSIDIDSDGIADCQDCSITVVVDVLKDVDVNFPANGTTTGTYNYLDSDFLTTTQRNTGRRKNSLIEFNLSEIPEGVEVLDAKASFYWADGNTPRLHRSIDGSTNSILIQRVEEFWEEGIYASSSFPNVNSTNEVIIDATTSNMQDIENIDVTSLFQDLIDTENHGIAMSIENDQSVANWAVIASSENPDESVRPILEITYSLVEQIDSDGDGVLDCEDVCPMLDDALIGTSCDDGNPATENDMYTANCLCEGIAPDLNTSISVLPNTGIQGPRMMRTIIQIREVSGLDTELTEDITITVTANPNYTFVWDPTATTIAGESNIENSLWDYDDSLSGLGLLVFRRAKDANGMTIPMPANGLSKIGMFGTWDAGASGGQSTISVTILNNSGGETNTSNNSDNTTINYLPQE